MYLLYKYLDPLGCNLRSRWMQRATHGPPPHPHATNSRYSVRSALPVQPRLESHSHHESLRGPVFLHPPDLGTLMKSAALFPLSTSNSRPIQPKNPVFVLSICLSVSIPED